MTEQVQQIDPWAEAFNRIDEITAKLSDLTHQYGGDVVDLTLQVVRFDGVVTVATGLVGLLLLFVCIWATWYGMMRILPSSKTFGQYGSADKYEFWGITFGVIGAAGGIINFIITVVFLTNFWAWIAIIEPKIALAKKVLDGIVH